MGKKRGKGEGQGGFKGEGGGGWGGSEGGGGREVERTREKQRRNGQMGIGNNNYSSADSFWTNKECPD